MSTNFYEDYAFINIKHRLLFISGVMDSGHWDTFLVGEFDPSEWYGFIYLIVNETNGKVYIGKKNFTLKKSRRPLKGKVKKRVQYVESDWQGYTSSSKEVQEDIETLGKENFSFVILQLASGRSELSFLEEMYQFRHDVLRARDENGEKIFYNRTIAHKLFAGVEAQSEISNKKRAESLGKFHEENPGYNHRSKESRAKISESIKRFFSTDNAKHPLAEYIRSLPPEERSVRVPDAKAFSTPNKETPSKTGTYLYQESKGLWAQTPDEWAEVRTKAGKTTGILPWWTNGVAQRRSTECPGDGWRRGRLPRTEEEKRSISMGMKKARNQS